VSVTATEELEMRRNPGSIVTATEELERRRRRPGPRATMEQLRSKYNLLFIINR